MKNKIQDTFDQIKADPQIAEITKQFLSKKQQERSKRIFRPMFQKAFAAACIIFILAMGIRGYLWMQTPVSYVSIDVNPSIELMLNRFDRVISAKTYNTEGEGILKGLSLKGKIYTDAIDAIVNSEEMKLYLTEKSELVFTVATNVSRENKLYAGVEVCSSHIGHNCHSVSTDIGAVSQAHKHNISIGKYYAWLQLYQYDNTITIDECKDMSISEIHELIREQEQAKNPNQEIEQETPDESCCNKAPSKRHGHHHDKYHE